MLAKKIWSTLSKVDVNKSIEKKGNLKYLSWSYCWSTLSDYFPDIAWEFTDRSFPDGTVEVSCILLITEGEDAVQRSMWLPVMDNRNKPIQNPDAFQINTAKMRCFVKCAALFGLGIYIYQDDLSPEEKKEALPISASQLKELKSLLKKAKADVARFCTVFGCKDPAELPAIRFDSACDALHKKIEGQANETA